MTSPFVVDARSLIDYQMCRRKHVLSHDWRPIRWQPKSLFDHCLRKAIYVLSSGCDSATVIDSAQADFMETAANPGLDVYGVNPYLLARDYCAMLETILKSLARQILLVLREIPPAALAPSTHWRFNSWADESGVLHRWITVSSWDEDDLSREMHSWYTTGDLAASGQSMQLHVIKIGQVRDGRRASLWTRAWKHPSIPNLKMHFVRKDGKSFRGWEPVHLADHREIDTDRWVDQMHVEGAVGQLMFTHTIRELSEKVCQDTQAQVLSEVEGMRRAVEDRETAPYHTLPMSRAACDFPTTCPYQFACYAENPVDPGTLGIYDRRQVMQLEGGNK